MKRAASTILLLGALLSSTALAQGTAVLTGKITDAATNAPVPDVVVTATSPRLQGEQIVVSDSTGTYRIPQLPPGIYSLRYEKEGYKPYSRAGLDVRADVTLRVNTLLLPSELGTTIEVVGTPPVIDVGSTSTGSDIGSDFVNNLALSRPGTIGGAARSFESLALTVPQATGDAFGVSVNGATAPENSYLVDGLSVNNTAYGINGSSLPIDFLDDVNVITGGYMPEYGRSMGGTISATTKSGGNEFHGSVFFNVSPGAFGGTPKDVVNAGSVLAANTKPFMIGDFGATLGGPIMKDKLWFFAGIQPTFSRYSADITLTPITAVDADGAATEFAATPAYQTRRFADDRQLNYLAKLTYLLNADNRVSLSWNGTVDRSGGNGSFAFGNGGDGYASNVPEASSHGYYEAIGTKNTNDSNALTLKLNSGFMDKRLLLDGSVGWFHQSVSNLPVDGSQIGDTDPNALINVPSIRWSPSRDASQFFPQVADACASALGCRASYFYTGGPGYVSTASLNNYQGKLIVTYLMTLLGHHVWKAGVDGQIATYDQTQAYTGGYALREAGPWFYRYRQYSDYVGPGQINIRPSYTKNTKSLSGGYFLQDSWQVLDKVTLNAGIRVDNQSLYGADGVNALTLANEISPRIGLIYDPTQSGKAKIFASYAKYYENIPLDLANRGLSGEQSVLADFYQNNVGDPGCIPGQAVNTGCATTHSSDFTDPANPNQNGSDYGISRDAIDPNISAPANSEIVAGGEYEVFANARVGLTYTHRELSSTIEDLSTSGGATFFLGNPGQGAASAFPKATRIYNAGTLTLTKSFSNLWLFQGSYTYAHAFGNYDGLVARDYGQLDPNITANFDLIQLLVNSNGPLSIDVNHTIKLYAAKEIPLAGGLSVTLGASYLGHSGAPTSFLGPNENPGYGEGAVFILPRGSGDRLPWYNDVDAHLAVNYRLSKDSTLSASIDAFNVFNLQGSVATDENYTLVGVLPVPNGTKADLPGALQSDTNTNDDGSPASLTQADVNPNFGNVTAYQAPRAIRLGVKLTF